MATQLSCLAFGCPHRCHLFKELRASPSGLSVCWVKGQDGREAEALRAGPSPRVFHSQLVSLGVWLGISPGISPASLACSPSSVPEYHLRLSGQKALRKGRVWVEARDGFMKSEDSSGPSECQGTVNGAQCLPKGKTFSF